MVFGAGGFLGARICALLADRGIEYRGLSRTRSEPYRRCDLAAMHPYALDTQIGNALGWSPKIALEQSLADS